MRLSFCIYINFYQIMSDTIYNDLKEQGLILSDSTQVVFPPIQAPKPGIIGQLASYVLPQTKIQQGPYQLIIVPILSNCFVVGRSNTLMCYKYEIDKQTGKALISDPNINNLRCKILNIHICDNKYLNDRGEIPFVVESANTLTLFYVDLKQNKIVERNQFKYTSTASIRFICEKEFLVLTSNFDIHHIAIQSGKMNVKNKIPANLTIQKTQQLRQINILGNIDEQQDSIICLFYSLRERGKQNSQILKVKEYQRDLDGKITEKPNQYIILSTQHSVVLTQNYSITSFQNYYCILIKNEILILKKKFDRYLFIDNVMEKIGGNKLKLHQKGIVTSHSSNSMEVSCILFADPKCYSKLLDNIQIDFELSEGFMMVWPFKNQKDTSLMFLFKKDQKIIFFNLIKMDPNTKMLKVVANTPKEKVTMVQEIAVNLGINKKDFYLNLWVHSKRELADIHQFLLPCWDISSIKKQLRMTLRRKKIQVCQLLKILQKLGNIIRNQLKQNLSQQTLKQYIKNQFLLRKIKLKQASKKLDHRQMDKVYNSSLIDMFVQIVKNDLYPSQKQLDPLHAMVQQPIKEETNLKHVFQEFRIMILEDYKRFLIQFLSHFSTDQIVNVIENYHFLLPIHTFRPNLIIHEPDYMTQVQLNQMILKAQKTQPQWFSDMTSIEFARQLSKERIQKQLHEFYPTSKITEAINTLINSQYGVKQKLHKHGLISCTMSEFREKLHDIQQIKLFLKVCQFANQHNLESDDKKDDLSIQIVQIFKNKNKLDGKAYQTVRLYTSMHRFMLKNQFCQKKVLSAEELIQLTPQDLVALFFLENRQRKQFIFKQFRNLFTDLYGNPNEFNNVIKAFIKSQNCSRIELQIFINQIKSKGEQFQIDNQDLIQLIIDGFCMKLQIRQDTDAHHFLSIMQDIQLSKKLGMKINKIIQVQKCLHILNVFNCQKYTYYDILCYQENNYIFKLLLDKYFNQDMKKDFVKIQEEEISLDFCRNMLTVLLYLQESVYYEITVRDLLLTYGEVLIQWKQFQVIKGIVYDQGALQKLEIDRQDYIHALVKQALDKIYQDQQIIYDPQTKQHIRNILDIYQENNVMKSQEFAKLELVDIFQSWGTIVHSYDIFTVTEEWINGQRKQFVQDLIQQYITFLNFDIFIQIYRCLQRASGRPSDEVDLYTNQFVEFSLYYADKLLQQKNYDQIMKILAFVKTAPSIPVGFYLLSQTFLKAISIKYPQIQNIEEGRHALQYYTQNFDDDMIVQEIFEHRLIEGKFFEYIAMDRNFEINVDPAFCFKKQKVSINLDFLWDIAQSSFKQKEDNLTQVLYYNYYFLLMIFRKPQISLTKLHKISYSLWGITDLIFRLQSKLDQNSELWAINTFSLIKKFRKGLYLEALTRIKQINSLEFKNDQAQLEMIKNILKDDKQTNGQLLKCLARVQQYTSANKGLKKTQREIRYDRSKAIKQEQPQNIEPQNIETEPEQETNNATLNLRKLKQRKLEISNASAFIISQKDILDQIYEQENIQKQQNRKKHKTIKQVNNFFLPLMNSTKQNVIQEVQKRIYSSQWQKLRSFTRDELVSGAQNVYGSENKDFHDLVAMIDELGIGDQNKIKVGRLCKIYQGQIQTKQIKKLFSFQFFVEPLRYSQAEFNEIVYMSMRPKFSEIISGKDNEFIRSLANFIGSILEDNIYIARFYIDILILSSERKLDSQTVIRIRIMMNILREHANQVRNQLTLILGAYKDNSDLKSVIKQELLTCIQDLKDNEAQEYIKQF